MMIIGSIPVQAAQATDGIQRTGAEATVRTGGPASSSSDRVELSGDAALLATSLEAATASPDVRSGRVDEARERLRNGRTGVDPLALADAILRELLPMTVPASRAEESTRFLREVLERTAGALAAADLDGLLRSEVELEVAIGRIPPVSELSPVERVALRQEVEGLHQALDRCRRLSAALLECRAHRHGGAGAPVA